MINGIINVYKEAGYTSHDVVARLRGILRQKKIGHTGTLDPDATGVLPVCLGRGTKLCDMLTDENKTYEAVLCLGIVTDTQDISGTILRQSPVKVTEAETAECICSFEGEYMQIPPMYSALKINGRKLYELAREGIEVERKARKVHFHKIEICETQLPNVKIRVTCSKGTYIRTLCHDIGAKLGCGGCMESLLRTQVGRFELTDSVTLAEIETAVLEQRQQQLIIPIEEMFTQYFCVTMKPEFDKRIYNGNMFEAGHLQEEVTPEADTMIRVYDSQGVFVAIYRYQKSKCCFTLVKMFFGQ